MARVKNPLLSQEAHGALAGIEYRTSTYGNIVGRRSITPARQTVRQLAHRALFTRASTAWRNLPTTTKQQWNKLAEAPLDGRTTYIAAYIRLAPHNALPLPRGLALENLITFTNFVLTALTSEPPALRLTWSSAPFTGALMTINAVATSSRRLSYTHDRIPFSTASLSLLGIATLPIPCKANIAHVRIMQIHPSSGAIMSSHNIRQEIIWP
jgi:hypothetical protein